MPRLASLPVKSDNKSTIAEGVVREIRQRLFDLQKDYEDEKVSRR
jgi:hypothetical protein